VVHKRYGLARHWAQGADTPPQASHPDR